jgi:hypothetical protein
LSAAEGLPGFDPPVPDARLARVERELSAAVERLRALEARVRELDGRDPAAASELGNAADTPLAFPPATRSDGPQLLTVAGRCLLGFGGAYLIRALTESAAVPPYLGIAAGLAYAAGWLFLAVRAAAPLAGNAYGATAALVAFPLLWETVGRFHVLGAGAAAAAIVAACALFLACAARARLYAVAWIAVLGALAASAAVLGETLSIRTVVAAILSVSVATLVLEAKSGWGGPRWPAAIASDLSVLALLTVYARPGGPPAGYGAITAWHVEAFALALPLLTLAAAALRSLTLGREIGAFEILQVPAALAVGLFAAVQALLAAGISPSSAGVAALAAGTATYVASREAARKAVPRAALAFEWIGFALLLAGAPLAFGTDGAAVLWCVLAGFEVAFPIGKTPTVHAALYLAAAALASGLAGGAVAALAAHPPSLRAASLAILAAAGVCDFLSRRPLRPGAVERATRLAFASAWLVILGTLVMEVAARVVGDAPAWLSASGTAVLALSALGLAAVSRTAAFAELRVLVTPVLVVCGLKLLAVDLRAGTPTTLVATFVLYGAALLATPRLVGTDAGR